jgi:hypothetical protein
MHCHNPPAESEHAKAVLLMTSCFAEEGFVIITSNTDEKADPQIFAQNGDMLFSFYFVRANPDTGPTDETIKKWVELAERHQVEPFYVPVNTANGNFDIIPLTPIKQ